MIRTLYVRVVLTFLFAVALSLVASFLIASQLHKDNFLSRIEDDMMSSGQNVVYLAEKLQPQDINDFFIHMSDMKNFNMRLYNENAEATDYNRDDQKSATEIHPNDVMDVLNGKVFRSLELYQAKAPSDISIGLPLQIEGKKYALFLFPFYRKQMREFQSNLNFILLIVLLTGGLFILVASRYVVNPLRKLTEATKRLSKGNFNVRVDIHRKDELGILADSFNHMAEELMQMEKMRQDFVSNVSHEIQTPLTSIRGFSIELQNKDMSEEERIRYLKIIEKESERLARLSENLLKLASLDSEHHPFHPKTIRLDEQLRRIVVACEPLWSAKALDLELTLPKTNIAVDEDGISQVWTNLLFNSIKFSPYGGHIRIEIVHGPSEIEVSFTDTGSGIGAEDQQRIFQRFYKVDASRQSSDNNGNGLGLAIAKKIVEIHQGQIIVTSEVGKGAVFTVILPIS